MGGAVGNDDRSICQGPDGGTRARELRTTIEFPWEMRWDRYDEHVYLGWGEVPCHVFQPVETCAHPCSLPC